MSATQIGPDVNCNRRHAVTLIELLVIVGVLVFVIAMLFPALSKAQRQSRTVTCLSNLHQLYMGYAAYLPLNQQQSLRYDTTESAFWPNVLRPTFPDVKDILLCPEASAPSYGLGTDKTSWGPYDRAHGSPASMAFIGNTSSSYGFNGWLYAGEDETFTNRLFRTHLADRVPVFAESNWVDGWPPRSEGAGRELPPPALAAGAGLSRFELARHGQSINASFLDGHSEQIPLDRLSELKWSLPPRPQPGELHRGTSWETR
ncbi:MAG TPA: type II secretion system protein [Tepidisphaeraceae bacterium]|jgi:prepilin-type processing-associated H-X9-DG protein|nr:type II secretion system protein [Tepidisphaeraceae bacterium]